MPTLQPSMSLLALGELCGFFLLVTQILRIKAAASGLPDKPSSPMPGSALLCPPYSSSPNSRFCFLQ